MIFPRPYSPDFNPIENVLCKLTALLRKVAARTVEGLWRAIHDAIDTITLIGCAYFFNAARSARTKWRML